MYYWPMQTLLLAFMSSLILLYASGIAKPTQAATVKSDEFVIETGITPTPTPFQPLVQTGFISARNAKPLRISVSSDLIDYGPITPTNHIKRNLTISVDPGSTHEYDLFTFANHPLTFEQTSIPDTTCDEGSCSENVPSIWINPFTFGLGFSFDDMFYQQFADVSKNEAMVAIPQGKIIIKLNVNQTQPLPSDKHYEHNVTFTAVPRF